MQWPGRGSSLFWPGRIAAALTRADALLAVAIGAVAVAVRWSQVHAPPIVDEPAHFQLARQLWMLQTEVMGSDGGVLPPQRWLFWQRPVFSLAYWPAANLGFDAYRVAQAVISGAIPALAFLLVRRFAVPLLFALGAGLVLAFHPQFVVWGGYVLPDPLLAVFTLLGLHAAHSGRPLATATLLLLAAWTKETGIVTAGALLLLAWWREADTTRVPSWPVGLGRFGAPMLLVLAVAFAPLVYSLSQPWARFPGWLSGGDPLRVIEHVLVLVWLAPLLGVALWLKDSRRIAFVAACWVAFFLVYRLVFGKFVNDHYVPVPGVLVVIAATVGLAQLARRLPSPRAWAVPVIGVTLALAFAVQVVAPEASALNRAVASPLTMQGQWNLEEAKAWRGTSDTDLVNLLARVPSSEQRVFAVDVHWSFDMMQVPDRFNDTYIDSSFVALLFHTDLARWIYIIEEGDVLLLIGGDSPTPLQALLRETYAPCLIDQEGPNMLIRGADCKGVGAATDFAHKAQLLHL